MQYESGDHDSALKRLEQVKKQFKEQLGTDDFKREQFVLALLPELIESNGLREGTGLHKKVKKFVTAAVAESVEDGEILRYRAWLSPKVGLETEVLDR